ncbi:hypothetical protein QVD17_38014 [Tagetes erecta]|uniref:Replication factor A C-terminal domain-containing protein n=1 Tax=Tagetes erecta TaxID=13708 RepID=A0AAD8ND71_TARER|nr:hypothetical protein QVD17_38014 [Tagetes erecta]
MENERLLTDYIGLVDSVTPVLVRRGKRLRKVAIRDEGFNQLEEPQDTDATLEQLTIAEIHNRAQDKSQKTGQFYCRAIVTEMQAYRGWYYAYCTHPDCSNKAFVEEDTFVCADHVITKEPTVSYCLNTIITDDTGSIKAAFFNNSMTNLLGHSCKELVIERNNKKQKVLLVEIHALEGVPLLLTANIKPDGTIAVDNAKRQEVTSPLTPCNVSQNEADSRASTSTKDKNTHKKVAISPVTPDPKNTTAKRETELQTGLNVEANKKTKNDKYKSNK